MRDELQYLAIKELPGATTLVSYRSSKGRRRLLRSGAARPHSVRKRRKAGRSPYSGMPQAPTRSMEHRSDCRRLSANVKVTLALASGSTTIMHSSAAAAASAVVLRSLSKSARSRKACTRARCACASAFTRSARCHSQ